METENEIDISGIQTTEELKAELIETLSPELAAPDIIKLKFCIYLRKSTNSADKQERSIEDQKADCLDAAGRLAITIDPKDIIEERENAKALNIRTIFRKMIDDLKKGRYNTVLSYYSDRLSRNSLGSGESI